MPRGKTLTEFERGQIYTLSDAGVSISDIAREIGRSWHGVANFIKNPEEYGKNKRSGRKRKLSEREQALIRRKASNSSISATQIQAEIPTKVSKSTVLRVLNRSKTIVRAKLKVVPMLTKRHREARLHFARKNMATNWSSIIFSDEKKWNLDGPDGNNYYWHDLRKEPRYFSKRNFGGGSVMIWGAFTVDKKLEIQFTSCKMNSDDHVNVLQSSLRPFIQENKEVNWIFQQDNARIHTSKVKKTWLENNNIETMEWPACSPDLNPIENLWGILARHVYADFKQYNNVAELRTAIIDAWENVQIETLQALINSMPNRIYKLITAKGGHFK